MREPEHAAIERAVPEGAGFYHGLAALPSRPEVKAGECLRLELANGSRVVSLPGSERTTRGYSKAALIILDEAARIRTS